MRLPVTLALLLALPADEEGDPALHGSEEVSRLARAHRMAERALQWLSPRIQPDGSVMMTPSSHQPKLAAAALTALAFMANGHTADDSEDGQGARVRAIVGWLMTQAAVDECVCAGVKGAHPRARFADAAFTTSDMHGQGYVTWALAMAYGMSLGAANVDQRAELARVTQAAVHCIELAQHHSGGWWYHFKPETEGHEGSVTVTVLEALRSAKEAGLRVDVGVIDRAVDYLRRSQVDNPADPKYGAFRYRLGDSTTSFALTAAAVSSLNQTGDYDSRHVDLGIAFMRQKDPLTHASLEAERWPWYGRFYATQAYWQYRDLRHFRAWYRELLKVAEAEQDLRDGRFTDHEFGDVYATAMGALTLGVPFGYLPSFQR